MIDESQLSTGKNGTFLTSVLRSERKLETLKTQRPPEKTPNPGTTLSNPTISRPVPHLEAMIMMSKRRAAVDFSV